MRFACIPFLIVPALLPVTAAAAAAEILGVEMALPEGHEFVACDEVFSDWPKNDEINLTDCVGVLPQKSTSPSWFFRPFGEAGWRTEGDAFSLYRECDLILVDDTAARAAPYERVILFSLERGGFCRPNRGGID